MSVIDMRLSFYDLDKNKLIWTKAYDFLQVFVSVCLIRYTNNLK